MSSTLLIRRVFILSTVFLISILFSCKKDGELSPDFDNGNLSTIFTDTFSLKSTVIEGEPAQTGVIPLHLLGVYNDPIFGTRSSSIYTNVGISGETDFGADFMVDSLILSLDLSQSYGDNTSSFTVKVFELSTPLQSDSSYFSNTYSPVENIELGSALFTPGTSTSVLRVVITEPGLLGKIKENSKYADNAAFSENFKGLYIVTSDTAGSTTSLAQGEGAFGVFDFNSVDSKVTLHYNDSLTEDLIINSDVKTYSRFINDYSGTDIEKHLSKDISRNINRFYVSDMEGVKTKIELPSIKNLANQGNVAINKAELVFTIEHGTDESPNDLLQAITLAGIDDNGNVFNLIDASEGDDHFGGTFSSGAISFNITRHLQQIINGTITDNGLYLTPNPAIILPNRAVFNSENSPTFKANLEITYSKL